ncbi:aminotransferase class I/II-fold pyridoxal phosphate-dependent enzyme [Nakamurella sp. YIM 132087]|uniref:cysteine-S-conjugate beta-lyase n=1 Tax=Nakamurella alba TaxID=2665158 RepID=A0A7K1FIM1_9ACTN|nr:aminotransferase class I/II-fold pyridoxal phosphate-dependent enzyme [Nakamurella alba]MTD13975.1 aminotransferase class I/II-fold pyridoxal phosphate-dependent enzyme [Nakamurella alba]
MSDQPAFANSKEEAGRRRGVKWQLFGPDVLPAWVADLDVQVPEFVRSAVLDVLDRHELGYPSWDLPPVSPLADAFAGRMSDRYGWSPDPTRVRGVNDLVQAVQLLIDLTTPPGAPVLLPTPAYPPFVEGPALLGRRLVPVPADVVDGRYVWDPDGFREAAATGARVLVLVNPQNPTGRVLNRDELEQVAEIALAHDLWVIADEIHAELVHAPHRHLPFASLGPEVAARTITVTSAGKSFNLAGMSTAVVHLGPDEVLRRWDEVPARTGAPNVLGVAATLAAWQHGDAWLAALGRQLSDRRDQVGAWVRLTAGVDWIPPEATYLGWLDCRGLPWPDPAAVFLEHGVAVNPGHDFGPGAGGFVRLNFGTGPALLQEILDRMGRAVVESGR